MSRSRAAAPRYTPAAAPPPLRSPFGPAQTGRPETRRSACRTVAAAWRRRWHDPARLAPGPPSALRSRCALRSTSRWRSCSPCPPRPARWRRGRGNRPKSARTSTKRGCRACLPSCRLEIRGSRAPPGKQVMPRWPASGLALANNRNRPASAALVIQSLRPVMKYSSPRLMARVASANASDPGASLRQRERSHHLARQLRQIAPLLVVSAPANDHVVGDGVLDVDDDRRRGIHRRQRLHRQHGLEEAAALAAEFFGNLDAHQSQVRTSRAAGLCGTSRRRPFREREDRCARARSAARRPGTSALLRSARSREAEARWRFRLRSAWISWGNLQSTRRALAAHRPRVYNPHHWRRL